MLDVWKERTLNAAENCDQWTIQYGFKICEFSKRACSLWSTPCFETHQGVPFTQVLNVFLTRQDVASATTRSLELRDQPPHYLLLISGFCRSGPRRDMNRQLFVCFGEAPRTVH